MLKKIIYWITGLKIELLEAETSQAQPPKDEAPKAETPKAETSNENRPQQHERPGYNYRSEFSGRLTCAQINNYLRLSFQERDFKESGVKFKGLTMDTAIDGGRQFTGGSSFVGLNGAANEIIFTFFAKHGFIGWQLAAMLAQHWLINNACTMPMQDALRNGWQINSAKQADLKEKTEAINTKFNFAKKLFQFGKNRKVFGVGIALPIIDGIKDYSKPFNADIAANNNFKGINVIDPYWCVPQFDNQQLSDPMALGFYEPEYYQIYNKKIHRSHLIIWKNDEPADILKPSYYFGGIPLPQMIYERVYAADKTANEAPELALTKRLLVAKTDNMASAMFDFEATVEKIKKLSKLRSNQGVYLTEDELKQIDTTLSGFAELINQQYELVAAVARIPVHKLLKTQPRNALSGKGDFSMNDYEQELQDLQSDMTDFLHRLYEIAFRSEYGIKDVFEVKFNSPRFMDDETKRDIESKKIESLDKLTSAAIISAQEAREAIVKEKLLNLEIDPNAEADEDEDDEEVKELIKKAKDAAFKEDAHKRDADGKFATGGSSSSGETDGKLKEIVKAKSVEVTKAVGTRESAESALEKIRGKNIVNKNTKITAQINSLQIDKITSNTAVQKSIENGFTRQEHFAVAENIKELFENAVLFDSRKDRDNDTNIKSIKTFIAPFKYNNRTNYANMLLKESEEHGHRVYTLELQGIEKLRTIVSTLG
jgi:phage-related protein (TIGR01555 family)